MRVECTRTRANNSFIIHANQLSLSRYQRRMYSIIQYIDFPAKNRSLSRALRHPHTHRLLRVLCAARLAICMPKSGTFVPLNPKCFLLLYFCPIIVNMLSVLFRMDDANGFTKCQKLISTHNNRFGYYGKKRRYFDCFVRVRLWFVGLWKNHFMGNDPVKLLAS